MKFNGFSFLLGMITGAASVIVSFLVTNTHWPR